ncbi:serine/threonine protein kinase [Streptosporangium sp. NPDC000396]|uniref:serine/threonine protein kinase n=1 Tax=Streptosporangium sp. NPDC000396 TaxID=3366185 RepID=UPI00368AE4E0
MDLAIGPYRVISRLGQGGTGEVLLARGPDGRQVAIKIINPYLTADPGFRQWFQHHAETLSRVAQFCTVPVLEAGLDGDRAYLVTEYVEGPDLRQRVGRHGPLTGSSLDSLAVSTAVALQAIHAAGIIHQGLKPSNILLGPLGPRVTGFGMTRFPGLSGVPAHTAPAYVSPEQARGEEATEASDVFAWGGVILYAATGREPFGGTGLDTAAPAAHAGPDLTGLHGTLHDLVGRALAGEPGRRPSVRNILQSLTGVSDPAASLAKPPALPATNTPPAQLVAADTPPAQPPTPDTPPAQPPAPLPTPDTAPAQPPAPLTSSTPPAQPPALFPVASTHSAQPPGLAGAGDTDTDTDTDDDPTASVAKSLVPFAAGASPAQPPSPFSAAVTPSAQPPALSPGSSALSAQPPSLSPAIPGGGFPSRSTERRPITPERGPWSPLIPLVAGVGVALVIAGIAWFLPRDKATAGLTAPSQSAAAGSMPEATPEPTADPAADPAATASAALHSPSPHPTVSPSPSPSPSSAKATASPTPVRALPLQDDFSGTDRGWTAAAWGKGRRQLGRGAYRITTKPDGYLPLIAPGTAEVENTTIIAKVRMLGGKGNFGVFCRGRDDAAKRYEFSLTSNGNAYILKSGQAASSVKHVPIPGFRATRLTSLGATCRNSAEGTRLILSVNGKKLVSQLDRAKPFTAGSIGMFAYAWSDGSGVDVSFNSFEARP